MQVIKTEDHKLYECPLKYTPSTNYTARCSGTRCMWWTFTNPPDTSKGYCGKC